MTKCYLNAIVVAVVALTPILCSNPAFSQVNEFRKIVGKWNESLGDGVTIIIDDNGDVFTQSSDFPLSGSYQRCTTGGANFCFSGQYDGDNFVCAYRIAFPSSGDALVLRATNRSFIRCPEGRFERVD